MTRPRGQRAEAPHIIVKTYPDPGRRAAAARHLRFLYDVCAATGAAGIRLPTLVDEDGADLVMGRLDGVPPGPGDLPVVAAALGQLHAAAFVAGLHRARLDEPFVAGQWAIPSFRRGREHLLAALPASVCRGPAALYKDCNIRNVLLLPADGAPAAPPGSNTDTPPVVGIVDFDDLTLAPLGYDLAKLLVSAAMTYGAPASGLFDNCLDAYNDGVRAGTCQPAHRANLLAGCSHTDLVAFAEVHHLLTAKYLGSNGYRHLWPDVRPWPAP